MATKAVLPYAEELARFPAYLQQLDMESNGKSVRLDGSPVDGRHRARSCGASRARTASTPSTNCSTRAPGSCPPTSSASPTPHHPYRHHHDLLVANLIAQAEALAFGRDRPDEPWRSFAGDRPSTTIVAPALTPSVLGQLIALYEHIVFVQGVVWGINSFDQWGVELGKELANRITPELTGEADGLGRARRLDPGPDRVVPRHPAVTRPGRRGFSGVSLPLSGSEERQNQSSVGARRGGGGRRPVGGGSGGGSGRSRATAGPRPRRRRGCPCRCRRRPRRRS